MLFALTLARTAAASHHLIELQQSSHTLLSALSAHGDQLGKDCPTVVEPTGLGPSIVDHVDWPDDVQVHPYLLPGIPGTASLSVGDVPATLPVAHLPLEISFRTLDCVYDPTCSEYDVKSTVVWLDYALSSGADGICAEFLGTSELPPGADEVVADQIERFGRPCADPEPMFGPLLDLLYDHAAFEDVGIAADLGADVLAIRASIADPVHGETVNDWRAFLEFSGFAEYPTGKDRVIVPHELLGRALVDRLDAALTCGWDATSAGCLDDVEPTGPGAATWDDALGVLTAEIDVAGPWCWTVTAATSFDVTIDTPPGSQYLDEWVYTLHLTTDVSDGLCEGSAESVREAYDAVFAGLGGGCTRDDDRVACEAELPTFRLPIGPTTSTWFAPIGPYTGVFGGLSLSGASAWDRGPSAAPLDLSATAATYAIRTDACHASAGYEGVLGMDGGPGELCDAADFGLPTPLALDDTLDVFDFGYGTAIGDRTYTLAPTAAFWADPYGPLVTVWTTAGAETIALPKPIESEVGSPNVKWLLAVIEAWMACHPLTDVPPIPGWFDLHWLVDPPPPYRVSVVGTGWVGATATLDQAQVVKASPAWDEALGLTTVRGGSAVLSTRWTVVDPKGAKLTFAADVGLPATLAGTDDALVPLETTEVSIAVPASALPRGVKSMAFTMPLPSADLIFTATPGK